MSETKYVTRPSWTGNSKCLDMFPVQDKPKSDTPIDDYLQGLDDKISQSQKEIKQDAEALKTWIRDELQNNSDYVLSTLDSLKKGEVQDRIRTGLYWGAFIALIYINTVAPVFNAGFDLSKKIIGFLPIASNTNIAPANQMQSVPSKLDPARIVSAMQRKGYRVRTGPGELNVVYVFNPNFSSTINEWSDRRMLITYKNNQPVIVHDSPATIKGGKPSWLNPPNPKGYPVIVPGQYDAWAVGYHKGKRALAQVGSIPVMRTKDQGRTWRPDRGLFGINQHRGGGATVRNWSEGCLVSQSGHEQFMETIYTDPGYRNNKSFRFLTTIISINDLDTSPQPINIGKKNAKQI